MANVEGPLNAQRKRFGTDISAVFKQNIFPDKVMVPQTIKTIKFV